MSKPPARIRRQPSVLSEPSVRRLRAAPEAKTKSGASKKSSSLKAEFEPAAWARFERAIRSAAQTTAPPDKAKPKKRKPKAR